MLSQIGANVFQATLRESELYGEYLKVVAWEGASAVKLILSSLSSGVQITYCDK